MTKAEQGETPHKLTRAPLAHLTKDGRPHYLEEHLREVGELAAKFASAFGAEDWGRIAGLWRGCSIAPNHNVELDAVALHCHTVINNVTPAAMRRMPVQRHRCKSE
jgi:hypothetical protein